MIRPAKWRMPAGIQLDIDQVIGPPGLGTRPEVLGAMALKIAAE